MIAILYTYVYMYDYMCICMYDYICMLYTYYIHITYVCVYVCMIICTFLTKLKINNPISVVTIKQKCSRKSQSRCDYKPNQPHISEPISLSSNVIIPDFYIFDFQVICTFVHHTWGPLNTFSKTHL